MIRLETMEDRGHYAALTAVGREHGVATARYAAAMHFHARGMIAAETLEAFRTLSPLDLEDPHGLLERLRLLPDIELAPESDR